MSKQLTRQVALVTGGGRGLGRGFAQAMALAGAAVAITARTKSQINETVRAIEDEGGQAVGFSVDVTNQGGMEEVIEAIESGLGPIEILVNNAGVVAPTGRDWEIEPDDWWRAMKINLKGTYICTRAILLGMISRGHGRIINITSGSAYNGHPYMTSYSAAKAAISQFTKCLATAVEEFGISVFAYSPGFARTNLTEYIADPTKMPEEASERFRGRLETSRYDSI